MNRKETLPASLPVAYVVKNIEHARRMVKELEARKDKAFQRLGSYELVMNAHINYEEEEVEAGCCAGLFAFFESKPEKYTSLPKSFPILPNKLYSPAFKTFINKKNTLDIIWNKDQQDDLVNLYHKQCWDHPLFSNPDFIKIALGAFANNKLNYTEFHTLFIMYLAKIPLSSCLEGKHELRCKLDAYSILQGDQFSENAKNYLLKNLPGFMYQDFNDTQIESLRLILRAYLEVYPAENVFFITDAANDTLNELLVQIIDLKAAIYFKENQLQKRIVLSSMLESALQLACYTQERVLPVCLMLGPLSKADIERCINEGVRPGIAAYPGEPYDDFIHGKMCSFFSAYLHDFYHAQHMARIGNILRMYNRIIQLERDHILSNCDKVKDKPYYERFSSSTWTLVDGEFYYFNGEEMEYRSRSDMENFCYALDEDNKKIYLRNILFDKEKCVTDLGILTFIDMAVNPSAWLALNCNFKVDAMIDSYKNEIDIAKNLSPYYIKENAKFNIFIFRAYKKLGEVNFLRLIEVFQYLDLLDLQARYENITASLVFKRNNLTGFLGLMNSEAGKRLDYSFSFTVLSLLAKASTENHSKSGNSIHKDFDFKSYVNIFKKLVLMYLKFSKHKAICKDVFKPICDIWMMTVRTNDLSILKNDLPAVLAKLASIIENNYNGIPYALTERIKERQVLIDIHHAHKELLNSLSLCNKPVIPRQ